MMGSDLPGELAPRADHRGRIYGVVVGVVSNNQDPEGMARIKVRFPWLSDTDESAWARVATPMAGNARGLYLLPEVGDEVLVMFEQGLVERPYVMGALWNGQDAPPTSNENGKNDVRLLRSRSGHTITLDDTEGGEKVVIQDKTGNNKIVIDAQENTVTLTSSGALKLEARGDLTLDSSEGDINLTCKRFSVKANAGYSLDAPQGSLEASSSLSIDCTAGVRINKDALEVI